MSGFGVKQHRHLAHIDVEHSAFPMVGHAVGEEAEVGSLRFSRRYGQLELLVSDHVMVRLIGSISFCVFSEICGKLFLQIEIQHHFPSQHNRVQISHSFYIFLRHSEIARVVRGKVHRHHRDVARKWFFRHWCPQKTVRMHRRFVRHIGAQAVQQRIILQVAEIEAVDDAELQLLQIHRLNLHRLIDLSHLGQLRVRFPGGIHQTVDAEVAVGGHILPEVAAVGVELPALRVRRQQTLIHPVPDAAALQLRVLVDGVPVVGEAAAAVAHRVRILAHNERAGLRLAGITGEVVRRGVHNGHDVGVAVVKGALVLHGTGAVLALQPVVGGLVADTVARLVAQRPDNDARVVLVTLVHIADTRHRSLLEVSTLRQRLLSVALRVRLGVGLVDDVEAVVVAQTVQFRRVRVVARAYRVDVVGFHQQDVFLDPLVGHVARLRVVLVAVHPTDGHRHPIYLQQTVFYADVAETDVHRHIIEGIALVILQDYPKGIQIGVFGIPGLHIGNNHLEMKGLFADIVKFNVCDFP